MEDAKIQRINFLAAKQREEGLTDEEKAEQTALRREYIGSYKRSLTSQLDNTYYIDEKGMKKKVQRKSNK